MATKHSVKLNPYDSTELDSVSYSDGDIVFDNTNGTVRVMDGITPGGHQLLRADFTNLTGVSRIVVSDAKPTTGLFSGSLWFNSANGSLYVYYSDTNGSRWIQPMNPVYGSGGGGGGGGFGGGNNLSLAGTAANAQAADGAGIIIGGANATILYNAATDAFVINKNITGNISSATKLQTARTINTVPFDGTSNITIQIAGSALTGTALASNIVSSSLTSVGTLTSLTTSGDVHVGGNLVVSGSQQQLSTQVINVATAVMQLAAVDIPTDATANGGGMLVFGATNKTFEWFQSTASWTSSEHINLQINKTYKINGTSVLSSTGLGSNVISSSLTSVGTIISGTWNGTPIAAAYGGTGLGTFVNNGAIYATSTSTLTSGTLPVAGGGTGAITLTGILKGNGTGAISSATAGVDFMSAPSGTGILKANNGSYSLATAVAGTDYLSPSAQATYTATQTFSGNASVLAAIFTNIAEPATITASAAGGTVNFDLTSQSILIFTTASTGNWTINFRGNSVTQTNSLMTVGQVMTATFIATNGASPYYTTACQIDGNAVSVKWQGAVTPVSGNANSYDIYTYTIVKTSSGFIVFGTQTRFA